MKPCETCGLGDKAEAEKEIKKLEKTGLRKWLRQRGITEYRFAQIMDMRTSTVSFWATGGRMKQVVVDSIELRLIKGDLYM